MSFSGQVVLVTGATRGIGKAITTLFGQQEAYVIGTATTSQGTDAIHEYFKAQGIKGEAMQLDVTQPDEIDAMMASLVDKQHTPTILVNNAGITADNLLLRMEDDEWYRVMETNLNAVYRLTKACIKPMFRARWGRVITIGSVVGVSGNAGQVNYTAAKAGVIGFSKSLAQEIASRGVTVNVVCPGFIDTDMTDALPELVKTELLKRIPMRHMGQPADIAEAVCFLASNGARYITGETIHVNGGMYMQ
ncbi:MAG: 3-oxoacyl-ACP reductase FabG [Gammaproteobacteria bacterium]|nr:3-oxoacyl-ACP reductase FabG [Gammaproteobacteria bacterium]